MFDFKQLREGLAKELGNIISSSSDVKPPPMSNAFDEDPGASITSMTAGYQRKKHVAVQKRTDDEKLAESVKDVDMI